jgi:hypothetical protein
MRSSPAEHGYIGHTTINPTGYGYIGLNQPYRIRIYRTESVLQNTDISDRISPAEHRYIGQTSYWSCGAAVYRTARFSPAEHGYIGQMRIRTAEHGYIGQNQTCRTGVYRTVENHHCRTQITMQMGLFSAAEHKYAGR